MAIDSNELLGQALGTCTLQRLVGRGGMGVVYLARQSRPRRTVAVKVLVPGMHIDPKARAEFLARFRREADAIAALDHVNIMPIYEYGELGELAFLVMPYVTGGTLRTLLEKHSILSLTEAIPIIEQAAAALDCAHAQGIIHRDLKPGNILFHADGRILLADFGLAKVIRGNEEHDSSSGGLSTLTSAGTIIGTPEYLSPEQSTGQPIGPYTDIYALGIVLYQMLSGRVPFVGSSPVTVALKHTLEVPPSLLQLNPALAPEVDAVVMKALAKRPEERYTSAGEFAQAFRAAAMDTSPPVPQWSKTNVEHIATITIPNEQAQDAERATEDIADEPTDERSRVSISQDSSEDISKVPTEEQPGVKIADDDISKVPTAARPHVTSVEDAVLPTYRAHVQSEASDDLHESATEEAPRIVSFDAPTQLASEAPTPQAQIELPVISIPRPVTQQPQQQQTVQKPVLPTKLQENRPQLVRRVGCQSAWMMLIGSMLTLILVVGGFVAYLHLMPGINNHSKSSAKTTSLVRGTATKPQPFTPPAPMVAAGRALYGTALPGPSCDSQGGQWSKQPETTITCLASATQLTNTGTGGMKGIFLDKLPGSQSIPDNYVLQVQVTMNSGTHGDFGVFFRNQSGSSTGAFAFLLNTTGTWKGNSYDNRTGTASTFVSLPVQGKMDRTFTLDIVVQDSTYTLYFNGVRQGNTESGQYLSGNLGLVTDSGTSVSFKNLAIYVLS